MDMNVYSDEFLDFICEETEHTKRRDALFLVEREIKQFIPQFSNGFYFRQVDEDVIKNVEDLINTRCFILNCMFQATPAEIERFRNINDLLYELSLKIYRRTADLYRTLLKSEKDESFDDDYIIEGTLCFGGYNDETSILRLEEDAYYGSDFVYMIDLIHSLTEYRLCESIVNPSIFYDPRHTADMTDKEWDCVDCLDDGVTWAEGCLCHPKLNSICVCYAVHDLCMHKPYSIPDLLRLNDFWSEAKLTCQHIVQQDGTRYNRNL